VQVFSLELGLTSAAILLSFAAPRLGSGRFARLERAGAAFARRRGHAILLAAALPLALRLALMPFWGFPVPGVHDEFGYLLTADTFVHGRLANPPAVLWEHFESPNLIQQPAYASVYPIAQSVFLALGRFFLHHDWFGVWLSVGLLCGALCWALQAWLPPSWALLGALLFGLRFGVAGYWMNSYWGGAVAALGGALILGALPRLRRMLSRAGPRPAHRTSPTLLFALGLLLLANSRPFEGLAIAVPVAVVLAAWLWRHRRDRAVWTRFVLPLALVLVAGGALMAFYCYRVTGNPARMPYSVSRAQYGFPLIFLWESPRPGPFSTHVAIRPYYEWLAGLHRRGFFHIALSKARVAWWFYVWPLLTVPLITLPRVLRDRRMRLELLILACTAAALFTEAWMFPHYAAPATAAFLLVLIQALRHLRHATRGLLLSRSVPLLAAVMLIAVVAPLGLRPRGGWLQAWCTPMTSLEDRVRVSRALPPGRHLVIVRYGPRHDPQNEWVYNGAEIGRARIVWAHDLGPDRNAELIRHFAGRQAWLVNDEGDGRISTREVVVPAGR
jgi:hypothetical protein